jgi:uncharacterized OB-fold protein
METGIARHWRLKAQRYRLMGRMCPDCHRKMFPPRAICLSCADKVEAAFPFDSQAEEMLILPFSPSSQVSQEVTPELALAAA